jgi:hypothetical protein
MAGSYRHITNPDGSFRGLDLLENRSDDGQAIEEMWRMIAWLGAQLTPGDPRQAIHQAWREGYLRPLVPGNAANERLAGFAAFWEGGSEEPPDTGRAWSLMQDDMAELLRTLGLGDYARPISPHEVMVREIIPEVRALKTGRAVS